MRHGEMGGLRYDVAQPWRTLCKNTATFVRSEHIVHIAVVLPLVILAKLLAKLLACTQKIMNCSVGCQSMEDWWSAWVNSQQFEYLLCLNCDIILTVVDTSDILFI